MTLFIVIGSLLLFLMLIIAWRSLEKTDRRQDSILKQRAIFNINEQLTFTRLKEILPDCIILAHVSFDALLTTKLYRTRHKYRNMVADFVILDEYYQILAIVALDDPMSLRRMQNEQYQDALLSMAGYRVIRYDDVPEYYQLRQDFLIEPQPLAPISAKENLQRNVLYHLDAKKQKVLG